MGKKKCSLYLEVYNLAWHGGGSMPVILALTRGRRTATSFDFKPSLNYIASLMSRKTKTKKTQQTKTDQPTNNKSPQFSDYSPHTAASSRPPTVGWGRGRPAVPGEQATRAPNFSPRKTRQLLDLLSRHKNDDNRGDLVPAVPSGGNGLPLHRPCGGVRATPRGPLRETAPSGGLAGAPPTRLPRPPEGNLRPRSPLPQAHQFLHAPGRRQVTSQTLPPHRGRLGEGKARRARRAGCPRPALQSRETRPT